MYYIIINNRIIFNCPHPREANITGISHGWFINMKFSAAKFYRCKTKPHKLQNKYINCWCPGAHFETDLSIAMQIWWKFILLPSIQIIASDALKLCTWLDNCAVVACAKLCSEIITCKGVTLKQNFHRIWIMLEKWFVKLASWLH